MRGKIKEAMFWILILTSIIMLLWRIFGDSPTIDTVLLPLIVALLVDHAILRTKFDNFEKQFMTLTKDFKLHLAEFRSLKQNLKEI